MASRSVNKVILVGRLGKDAESKFTQSGTSVTTFSVATSYRKKKGEAYEEVTEWTNIVAWKSENIAPYLKKGTQVYIEGRLQTRSYEKDGRKVYATEVVSEEIVLLGGEQRATVAAAAPAAQQDWDDEPTPF